MGDDYPPSTWFCRALAGCLSRKHRRSGARGCHLRLFAASPEAFPNMAMSEEDRTSMSKECSDEGIAKEHNDFCAMTKKLGGAN